MKLAISLHTFLRDELLFNTIKSIQEHIRGDYRLYITDIGLLTPKKKRLYKKLEKRGHKIIICPFDYSMTASRNLGIKKAKEPYILKVDDDFVLTENSRVWDMVGILEEYKDIGLISSEVKFPNKKCYYYYNFVKEQKRIVGKKEDWKQQKHKDVEFFICDVVPDYFLARNELIKEIGWDRQMNVGENEHDNFFLNIKYKSKWKVAYSPTLSIYHDRPPNDTIDPYYRYMRFRFGGTEKICSKWGVEQIVKI